jgi:hypothetical protein
MLYLRGVLRLIDADILILLPKRTEDVRVPQQYLPRENELVVIVHEPAPPERLPVRIVYRRDGDAARFEFVYLTARQTHILYISYRILQLFYVSALGILAAHRAEDLGKYRAVVGHKVKALRAGLARISVDYRIAYAVYRAKLQPRRVLLAKHRREAGAHFSARSDGVGHGQDVLGRDPHAVDKIRGAGDKRRRLAAAGDGKQQHCPVGTLHRLRLLRIEPDIEFIAELRVAQHCPSPPFVKRSGCRFRQPLLYDFII